MTPTPFTPGEEGIFFGLTEETYRKAPGCNVSSLKSMRLSAKHYLHELSSAEDEEKKSKALEFGTVTHIGTLDPLQLSQSYFVRPDTYPANSKSSLVKEGKIQVGDPLPWNGNAAFCDEWATAHQSRPILTAESEKNLLGACSALRASEVWPIIQMAQVEVCSFMRHLGTGLLLKGRADIVATDKAGETWVLDLKTVGYGGACEEEFARSMAKFNYHQQDAFYRDLFGATHFVFVAVEKVPPHDVACWRLDPSDVDLGRRANERALWRVQKCQRENKWPGSTGEFNTIKLPFWKRKQEERGEELE